MSLWSEFLNNDERKIHKWTHYFPAYERHVERYRNRPCLLVEIGVSHGGSLQMWKRYLGPYAQIVGIDINPNCADVSEEQIDVRIGSQTDQNFLQSVLDEFGTPDIVIDDGSHVQPHVNFTYNFMYPRTSPTGVYIVEDLHTAYWSDYSGGLKSPASFIETSKNLVDELNADHSRGALPPTDFTNSTLSMHYYDSVVVFERGRHLRKHAPLTGVTEVESVEG